MKTNSKTENRIRNNKAFTLAEALVAIIILLLVSAVVAAGIPAAMNAYEKVVKASNAQVLLSTTMNTLRNELLTAKNVECTSSTEVQYDNVALGTRSRIFTEPSGEAEKKGTIMYQRMIWDPADGEPPEDHDEFDIVRLISEETSDKDLELNVTFRTVSYNNTTKVVSFEDLEVKDKNDKTLTKRDRYSIRVIVE